MRSLQQKWLRRTAGRACGGWCGTIRDLHSGAGKVLQQRRIRECVNRETNESYVKCLIPAVEKAESSQVKGRPNKRRSLGE